MTDNTEILKTLQVAVNLLVKQQEEQEEKKQGYKIVQAYKRDKTRFITCKEASKDYPLSEVKFRELCRGKKKGFPSIKINSRYYIIADLLDEWFEKNIGIEI